MIDLYSELLMWTQLASLLVITLNVILVKYENLLVSTLDLILITFRKLEVRQILNLLLVIDP